MKYEQRVQADRAWLTDAVSGLLPEWAVLLSRCCPRYTFTTMRIHGRRAVVAAKSFDGSGPLLVVTTDEDEMRQALGLKPRKPS